MSLHKSSFLLATTMLAAYARTEPQMCATSGYEAMEEQAMHAALLRSPAYKQMAAQRAAGTVPPRSAIRDEGDIALIDESEGVVARRNLFNQNNRAVRFQPVAAVAAAYIFDSTTDIAIDLSLAISGQRLTLADDDAGEIQLPFAFPFFGQIYNSAFINSDGSLTFGEGDSSTSSRSVGRALDGAPRIAPLFTDLDPSQSTFGVRVSSQPERLVVSWLLVPVYSSTGTGASNTFQVRIYPDGRIEMAYLSVGATTQVIGISPGRAKPGSALVSFLNGAGPEYSGAILERFSSIEEIDTVFAAQRFYQTHEDSYDYLVIVNDLGVRSSATSVAWAATLRNDASGFGMSSGNAVSAYGSKGRLQTLINLGSLSQYQTDPTAPGLLRADYSALGTLAHEAGHRFLSYVSAPNPSGTGTPMVSAVNAGHWSFFFNAEASFMEGNRIRDNGAGTSPRFTTIGRLEGFSALDQYLMGLRPPDEVPPSFFVAGTTGLPSLPQVGVSFNGERRDVAVEELIYIHGRRSPDYTVAQRLFRFGFVLITSAAGPTPGAVAKLDRLRREFEGYYNQVTGGRAYAETSLGRSLSVSPAGLELGAHTPIIVSIERPRDMPVIVLLSSATAAASVPAQVTIPAGEVSAPAQLVGVRAGVDTISARATDSTYVPAETRVQVAASREALRLRVVSGGTQPGIIGRALVNPVIVELIDENNLPYPGIAVNALVREPDTLAGGAAVTDSRGRIRLAWTPGATGQRDMLITAEGVADLWVSITAK